jgi:putative redox protein
LYDGPFVIGVWQGLGMTTASAHRSVTVERTMPGRFAISNIRGGKITVGTGGDADFSPTELLLGAIGACTAIDVDAVTSRRAEPDAFEVRVDATKVRDDTGNRLTDIEVTFRLAFPMGEAGDNARALLPEAVRRSHDRWCTVGRTVENGTPIATGIID